MVQGKSGGRRVKALIGQHMQQQVDFPHCSQTMRQEHPIPGRAIGGALFLLHKAWNRFVDTNILRMVETAQWNQLPNHLEKLVDDR